MYWSCWSRMYFFASAFSWANFQIVWTPITCSRPRACFGPLGIGRIAVSRASVGFCPSAVRRIEIALNASEIRPARNALLFEAGTHAKTSEVMPRR